MGAWAFILAALKSLPLILDLVSRFKQTADEKVQRGLGHDQAVKEALEEGARRLAIADEAENKARRDHATDRTDGAFKNTEFRD